MLGGVRKFFRSIKMAQTETRRMREMKVLKAVETYCEGSTIVESCESNQIPRTTLYRLLKTESAQQALSVTYWECLDRIQHHLPLLVNDAMGTLRRAMAEPWAVTPQAVAAAKIVLDRVDRIENLLEKSENPVRT